MSGGTHRRPVDRLWSQTALDTETRLQDEVAALIVRSLHLDIAPETIDPDAPLFGEGLGLDLIDALELALAVSKAYGLEMKSDDERNPDIFGSLRSLTRHIEASRTG